MKRLLNHIRLTIVCLLLVTLAWPASVRAYAVLSHEAIIDAAWETHIKPLLLEKFPHATEEDLSRAQAYAYGGAIIQDMGKSPGRVGASQVCRSCSHRCRFFIPVSRHSTIAPIGLVLEILSPSCFPAS